MWFLVTQPFLSFDLVGSLPQIPSQTQIHCHACTQSECASPLPARRRIRLRQCHGIGFERNGLTPELRHAVVNHRSWIGLYTSTTCINCFMTSIFCTAFSRRFSGIHPEPHQISVVLELLLVPPHLHQVLSLHHVVNFSDTLLSSVLSLLLSWRFQLRVVQASFRVSLSSLPCRKASAPEASFSQSMFHDVSLADVQTSALPDRFCLGHRRT